jgi:GT2 family glycosyltransferase
MDMADRKLSLIVCTYRRPAQVRLLLHSVCDQSRVPDESLIVDGSADDETRSVVAELQNGWVAGDLKYYQVPPEERGLTRQRNYGIARARGEIVAFLDDDTIPEGIYFEEIMDCFARHPDAAGVGGYVTNEIRWRKLPGARRSLSSFRFGDWERREDYRWRFRRLLGLDSSSPPGWMPPSGHGRPISFLPPDGRDYPVEFLMGCAMAWRRETVRLHAFSSYFEGYGLYEDLEFCLRASQSGKLYVRTRATLAHYHAAAGRPSHFRYGEMIVRNGWFVWRRRWPDPPLSSRACWWATTLLLSVCRLADVARRGARGRAQIEAMGRLWGLAKLVCNGHQLAHD